MYYSGPSKSGRNGVAVVITNGFMETLENIVAHSNRVVLMQLKDKNLKKLNSLCSCLTNFSDMSGKHEEIYKMGAIKNHYSAPD